MPGGVSSPVRAFKAVGGTPIFIRSGQRATLTDIDGNTYIDYVGAYGPLIAGHAHERVVAALSKAIGRGTAYGAPTEFETQLATVITDAIPNLEMIRFVNSGTEAVLSAIRLARAATHRDKVVKCIGGYHGHVDALLAEAGSGVLTIAHADDVKPSTPGIPDHVVAGTLLAPFNDLDAARALFETHGPEIAAFIVEPVAGNVGVIPPASHYLQGLRELCDRYGSLLIFDEVMTGFRVAWGGAQLRFDVRPDLTCLGKIIGGGLPIGAYAGPRHLMEMISPAGPVYQAGTFSGNPLSMNAGLATLEILSEPDVYESLEAASATLVDGFTQSAQRANIPVTINRVGSMFTIFFTREANTPITSYADATACDTARYAKFFHALLQNGVYFPPSQFEACFVSLAHTDDTIRQTIQSADTAFQAIR